MFRPAFSALLISLGLAAPAALLAWHAYYGAEPATQSDPPPAPPTEESPPADRSLGEPDSTQPAEEAPSAGQLQLTPEMAHLRDQVRQALAIYHQRPVNARDHTPWETFHWILAYNVDAELYTKGPGGEKTNAVGWLCYNRPCRGQYLLTLQDGRPMGIYGVGLEGHLGQFLAILGQSRVMIDYPMLVKNRQFTVADLVKNCMLACESGEDVELTFLLIGLSHYLHPNAVWKNRAGETWSIPRLIREEISKPIKGAACGGTHRLMGLSYAVRKRQQHGLPITGEFRRAQVYVNDYIDFALRMQNPDGSLSTEWFTGRGSRQDIDRRLQTTGHMLEWIVFSVPTERLEDPQVVKSVDYVSRILVEGRQHEWKIGHVGHGLRSISLYDRRMFKPLEANVPEVARRADKPEAGAKIPVTVETPAGHQSLGGENQDFDPPPGPPELEKSSPKNEL
jgi:hypothetical protein